VPRVKTAKPNGRPSKKTAEAIARILKVVRTGLPLKFAAQAGNIEAETLSQWRAKDVEFAQALEQAQLESVEKRWKTIAKAAEDRVSANGEVRPGDWKAVAWQLERSFPSEFSRPEIQLGVQINNQTVNQTLVVTAEVAGTISSRVKDVDAKIERLLKDKRSSNANSEVIPEPFGGAADAMKLPPIVMPSSTPPPQSWWAQFCRGSSDRLVERQTAQWVVQTVASETLGSSAGSISFEDETVKISELLGVLERLTGTNGWQQLLKKSGLD
jgi:hypothetical protein